MAQAKQTAQAKYEQTGGQVFLSGNQALVRLVLDQSRRDEAAGLTTAGFVSGYRGSPLGHLDMEMTGAKKVLEPRRILFRSGVNEDMAATAVWGSQETGLFDAKQDGVFALWYSKGPGVDRSCDAIRHANLWGTSPHGGVVLAVGDDPMARSSSTQQQSEQTLASLCIPVFHAANVQDIYDYGLMAYALSRYAGVWVAVKTVSDIYESWYAVDVTQDRIRPQLPAIPPELADGQHLRWPDQSVDQDRRMLTARLPLVRAFAKANGLNKVTHSAGAARKRGIVTTGKSYFDVLEACRDLGISEADLAAAGVEIFKVGLVWPLEQDGVRDFAAGLDEILVVEECRPFLEPQVKDALFNQPTRPRVLGKRDADGHEWLPSHGEVTPAMVARVLARWLVPQLPATTQQKATAWTDYLSSTECRLNLPRQGLVRTPYFCSGCPHNSSTKVPEGSQQLVGIGCHYLVRLMDRNTKTYPHMGGEGGNWVGIAPFVKDKHIFVNVGDGTYYHSGSMAIRQAVAAGVNITYKILYNDAVAMTGGQAVDGPIGIPQITHELYGEGVKQTVIVSANPDALKGADLAAGVEIYHRDKLDQVQKMLREVPGVTALIYEQTCATELRRRRGRKLAVDPSRRVFINDRVCEGCGDCSVQSNCLSVQPLETEFGRKREIDQSACNKDFTCLKGFCPSFVSIEGGDVAKGKGLGVDKTLFDSLPEPALQSTGSPYGILVAGIGGTGVVTISNLIGAAAQAQGKFTQGLDLTGMAQKFGAVYCHLKIADRQADLQATRLSVGRAHLMIGADIVTAASNEALACLRPQVTTAVINSHETVTGAFTRDVDFQVPGAALKQAIIDSTGDGRADFYDTSVLAMTLTGNTIGANMMLLGHASQKGWLPVSPAALEEAITANGVAVPYNITAFRLGRLLAHNPQQVMDLAAQARPPRDSLRLSETLDDSIKRRAADLVAYQDQKLAARYRALVELAQTTERRLGHRDNRLSEAVARQFYRLLAIKDEYEIARLYTDGTFQQTIAEQFSGDFTLNFHFAPPLFTKMDPATGRPAKKAYGPWMLGALGMLAKLKGLRGTALDIFSYSAERKAELALVSQYEKDLNRLLPSVNSGQLDSLIALADLPRTITGFGPVRHKAMVAAESRRRDLLKALSGA